MKTAIVLAPLLLAGCAATPHRPPAEVASAITDELDAGRPSEARGVFDRVASDDEQAEKLYPVLFASARTRYEDGDWAGSRRILRFMAEGYPKALAVREALVYDLFLERASMATADDELLAELDHAIVDLERGVREPSVWVELARTQLAIDRGDLEQARQSFDRFLGRWTGAPPSLTVYIEDIDRYLGSG